MYFGANSVPSFEPPDILGAIDDLQVAGLRIEEAGVAGAHPAVRRLGLGGLLRVLVVAEEHAGRLEQHLAVLGDLHVDVDVRLADRVGDRSRRPAAP